MSPKLRDVGDLIGEEGAAGLERQIARGVPMNGRAKASVAEGESWEVPIPLIDRPAPRFPVDALPGWLGDFVLAVSEDTQTAPLMTAGVVLGVLSAALAGRYHVQRRSYTEPVLLYLLIVAEPGEKKSPVFKKATAPLRSWARDRAAELKQDILERDELRRELEERLKRARRGLVSKMGYEDKAIARQEVVGLRAELEATPPIPEPLAFLSGDLTPEALAITLKLHGERLAILSAESSLFTKLASTSSSRVNLDLLLKAFNMESHDEIRVGRRGVSLEEPALTICVCAQSQVVKDMAANPELRGRGFLPRFLFFVPPSKAGSRKRSPDPVPPGIQDAYEARVRRRAWSSFSWIRLPKTHSSTSAMPWRNA
jgi:replicative DNA helicase